MKKRLVSLFLAVAMLFTTATFAFAVGATTAEDATVDENTAATLALLLVLSAVKGSSGGETEWTMSTDIDQVIPMYDAEDNVDAYAITLSTEGKSTGYVIVSTDLSSSLISEYSWEKEFVPSEGTEEMALEMDTASANADVGVDAAPAVYYYGPLTYSYGYDAAMELVSESSEDALLENDEDANETYAMNVDLVADIQEKGLVNVSTPDESGISSQYIYNTLDWLAERHPGMTFIDAGYHNLGDNCIRNYEISGYNACEVYAATNLVVYELDRRNISYTYEDVATRMKIMAVEAGFAKWDSSRGEYNYKIGNSNTKPLLQYGLDYYGIKHAAGGGVISTLASAWSTGKSVISSGYPIVLHIAAGSGYTSHAVTAFAWCTLSNYNSTTGNVLSYNFFKVKDGYKHGNTYVCMSGVTLTFVTYVGAYTG